MDFTPDPLQTLFLWRLLADDGGAFQNGLKPDLSKPRRDPLVKAGLLDVVKRKPSENGRAANFLQLTDSGWNWCAEHLDAEVSTRSTAAGPILHGLMCKLKTHLERHDVALADFICPPEAPLAEPAITDSVAVAPAMDAPMTTPVVVAASTHLPTGTSEAPGGSNGTASASERVRRVCFQLANGARGVRIYLADVRRTLNDLNRDAVDLALRQLEHDRALVLYPLDNPQEIRQQDAEAALTNSGGFARHIAYLP